MDGERMSRTARGRPRASSREMLEDAAFELFVEQGYAQTTVEQIAARAGVSRGTFFNYFPSKADLFWVGFSGLESRLRQELAGVPDDADTVRGAAAALLRLGEGFGPASVPRGLTQRALAGNSPELRASAAERIAGIAEVLRFHIAGRRGLASTAPEVLGPAYALTAAIVAALQAWADAGVARGPLGPHLARALEPVAEGFATTAGAPRG